MVAKNDASWSSSFFRILNSTKEYSFEEVNKIISGSSIDDKQLLSRNYFAKDGIYKRIIIYYATLLKYIGVLIPNPSFGKDLSTPHIQKRYFNALDYVDTLSLETILTNCSVRLLVDGSYYGVIQKLDKKNLVLLDLPSTYCRSNYLDLNGNDVVEFNVSYFNTIINEEDRQDALAIYPKVISSYYNKYSKNKVTSPWVKIPSNIGICFRFFDGNPLLINTIPAAIRYDDAVEIERERELEEIRKIIVQKIPHLNDGTLLFEDVEAVEMHNGAVGMLRGNKNISVLTTYADIDSIISKTSADTNSNTLEKMSQHIYNEAGVSAQLFAPTSSQSLSVSIKNDMALMMSIAKKYDKFITNVINLLFANSNINFKYVTLPINHYNETDFIADSFKLAQSGYSLILPTLALGISQRDIINLKDLENNVLKLQDRFVPLKSSYTQSASEESGRPEKTLEEKTEKTIENLDAM